MPILLIIAGIVFVGAILFSIPVRTSVFNTLGAAGMFAQGAWRRATTGGGGRIANFFANIWTYIQQLPGLIWAALGAAWVGARIALIILILFWAVWLGFWIIFGFFTNSIWSGLTIGFLLPLWSVMFILVKIPVVRVPLRIPYWVTTIALVIAVLHIGLGAWSPEIKGTYSEWIKNKKAEIANFFAKESAQTEPQAGTFAKVTETITAVDTSGAPACDIPEDSYVMIVSLKTVRDNSEGMLEIKCRDEYGRFSKKSPTGFVPSRLLDWKWKIEKGVKKAGYKDPGSTQATSSTAWTEVASVEVTPGPVWTEFWTVPDSGTYSYQCQIDGKQEDCFRYHVMAKKDLSEPGQVVQLTNNFSKALYGASGATIFVRDNIEGRVAKIKIIIRKLTAV